MKLSVSVLFGLLTLSSIASAKVNYVGGEITAIDTKAQTISILEEVSGEQKKFLVDNKTSKKLKNLKEGKNIVLKLESAEVK